MTTSSQLDDALKDVRGYLGSFPSDQLPGTLKVGESLIANYDPEGKPGSHWVAARNDPHMVTWFDSFAYPPDAVDNILHDKTSFQAYLDKAAAGRPVRYNHMSLQALPSNTCGEWCVIFIRSGGKLPTDKNVALWRPLLGGTAVSRDARVRRAVGIVRARA